VPGKEREKQWLREHFHELGGGCSATVPAALANGADIALTCLRRWPDQAADVVRECSVGVVRPGCLGQRILDNRASGGSPQDVIAIHAVSAAASAVQGRGALTVANVHICGEGYAGKSMTRRALMKCFSSSSGLYPPVSLPDIPLVDGRTLGMVSESLERAAWLRGDTMRVLFHDYGGQEEFRANHAAHLAAPNSVYLLVVPLWDKRPGSNHNKPMELEYIVEKYRTWLKFINTIVPVSERMVQCITVLNFARQFTAAGDNVETVVSRLTAVQDSFKANPHTRLTFGAEPILVNSNNRTSVHKRLLPTLKGVIADLAQLPVPIAPAVQTVLADMQVKDKWPLFSYESDLQALLRAAIREKHSPSAALITDPAVAEEVVRTIAEITQGLLESRRDIVVFPVQGGSRISINHPNWLTEQLLGNLFNPQKEVKGRGLEAHFMSAKMIAEAGRLDVQRSGNEVVDPSLFAKLLHHIGACIPVTRYVNGDAAFCTVVNGITEEPADPAEEYYFPAFITTSMQPTNCQPTTTAVERVIRRYTVLDPELAMIPPGYYPALFVAVAGLEPVFKVQQRAVPKQIWLYKDGMVLKVDASYRVIIRGNAADTAFELEVEVIRSDYPGSAFAEMEKIRDLIVNAQDWRSAVQLVESCIDPEERDRAEAEPVSVYQTLMDAGQNLTYGEALCYNGKQRSKPHVDPIAPGVVDRVCKLESTVEVVQSHNAVLAREIVTVQQHAVEQDDRIQHAEIHLQLVEVDLQQLRRECRDTLGRLLMLHIGPGGASSTVTAAGTLAGENRAVVEGTRSVGEDAEIDSLWVEAERLVRERCAALSAQQVQEAVMTECQRLVELEKLAVAAELREFEEVLAAQEHRLDQLETTVGTVQTIQENDHYSVYKVPFLAEVVPSDAKGTWKDAVRRQVCDVLRLHFYCPACGLRAASGKNHHGYLLAVPKGWVRTAVVTLEVTLFALQVASLFTPLPLPRLAEIVQYLPVDTSASQVMLDTVAHLQERAQDATTEPAAQQQVSDWLTTQRKLCAENLGPAPAQAPQRPVVTRSHVAAVRELLLQAKESVPPKHSGLVFAEHTGSKECAWVCVGCQDKFVKEGKKCLKIEVELN
jgi:hypothetical protein